MKAEWITRLEHFLAGNDFGKNWDGAYQDAVPTIRKFFHSEGFRTHIMSEWDSPSRYTRARRNETAAGRPDSMG